MFIENEQGSAGEHHVTCCHPTYNRCDSVLSVLLANEPCGGVGGEGEKERGRETETSFAALSSKPSQRESHLREFKRAAARAREAICRLAMVDAHAVEDRMGLHVASG